MKTDISSSAHVQWLVDRFYEKIKDDKLVGFIFTDVMKVNFEKHLPVMYGFWNNALFYTGGYNGNAMQRHINIAKIVPFKKKYFTRWLLLFDQTVNEYFEGEKATLAKVRAHSIATIMQIKIKESTVK